MQSAGRVGRTLALLIGLTACGAGFRHEVIGSARTTAGASGRAPAVAVEHPGDRHRAELRFALPRAVELQYRVACPGETFEGVVGESWDAYRERRLRELEAERQRDVEAVGSIVGAIAGRAGAGARAQTPAGSAEVRAEVDGQAVGRAAADASMPQVQLDPRDVGAQTHARRLEWRPDRPGQCELAVWSAREGQDVSGVSADMTVVRIVDIGEERAAARARHREQAIEVRGAVTASLVAGGADPHKRERERQAAAEARARELRLQAEARARELRLQAEAEARIDATALAVRGAVVRTFVANGCDGGKRQREREAERQRAWAAQQRAREARMRSEARVTAALRVRDALRAQLHAAGARDRRLDPPAFDVDADVDTSLTAEVEVETPVVVAAPPPVEPPAGLEVSIDAAVWVPAIEVIVGGVKVRRSGGWRHRDTGKPVRVRDHRTKR
jgi:hypothetical protein